VWSEEGKGKNNDIRITIDIPKGQVLTADSRGEGGRGEHN